MRVIERKALLSQGAGGVRTRMQKEQDGIDGTQIKYKCNFLVVDDDAGTKMAYWNFLVLAGVRYHVHT